MNFSALYQTLEHHKYYIFSLADLSRFYPDEKSASLKMMAYRLKKRGLISPLKKGLYELTFPQDHNIPDLYIANHLYEPSYVSLETALSFYSIIPEVSAGTTSITAKPTRHFRNRHGFFLYRSVQPSAFCGYDIMRHREFSILMAEPEKALVDFLYFKKFGGRIFDIGEERLNKKAVLKLNKKKMNRYAEVYYLNLKEFYAQL